MVNRYLLQGFQLPFTLDVKSFLNYGGNLMPRLFYSQEARIDAEVIAFAASPPLASIVIIIGGTLVFPIENVFPRLICIELMPFGYSCDALVDVGRDEDVDDVLPVAQHIVGRSAHKDATAGICCLEDSFALEAVKALLREVISIEIVISKQRNMGVE